MQNLFIYTKTCSVCNQEKVLADFVYQRGKPQARCRECNNKMAKEHYHKSFISSKKGTPWCNSINKYYKSYTVKVHIHYDII